MENGDTVDEHLDDEEAYKELTKNVQCMDLLANPDRPWNASLWHREFLAASGSHNPLLRLRRGKLLALIARNTVQVCKVGHYMTSTGEPVGLPVPELLESTLCTDCQEESPVVVGDLCVTVENKDCIDVAVDLVQAGFRPALLNMANAEAAGGGWKTGAAAQEEDLFRRSDYHLLVDQNHYQHPHFPLHGPSCIYTPEVRYFRRGKEQGYAFMDDPATIATIASAAYVKPETVGSRLIKEKEDGTLAKLRCVFNAAKSHGHDSIVLSAFGCGAFGNPPHAIAFLMKQVCDENSAKFKKIVIAIVEDDGCQNLRPFQQTFHQTSQNSAFFMSVEDHKQRNEDETLKVHVESAASKMRVAAVAASADAAAEAAVSAVVGAQPSSSTCQPNGCYSLDQLQDRNVWSTLGIDPTKRESYLLDSTFIELFGMSKDDFVLLPKWKAKQLKLKHGLF